MNFIENTNVPPNTFLDAVRYFFFGCRLIYDMTLIPSDLEIRSSQICDFEAIFDLYVEVAKKPGGLARLSSEITQYYVESFLTRSLSNGVSLLVTAGGQVHGEIHASVPEPSCFSHVLSDLTLAIHPESQGQGLGGKLFESLIQEVINSRPEINRIELVARESNKKALALYSSLGFKTEGRMENRICNIDGSYENDIPMAWSRP